MRSKLRLPVATGDERNSVEHVGRNRSDAGLLRRQADVSCSDERPLNRLLTPDLAFECCQFGLDLIVPCLVDLHRLGSMLRI
jgi:hypothetical protein